MDSYEATKIVFSRVQSLDPENASKIMGFIFIQDPGERELIRLAFGPENLLLSLINQAKSHLGILSNSSSAPSTPSSASPFNPMSNPNRPNPLLLQSSPRIVIPSNGFHMNQSSPSSPWSVSGFSDHRSPRPPASSSLSYAAVVNGTTNGPSLSFSPPANSSISSLPQFYSNNSSCSDVDSFSKNRDFVDPIMSPSGRSDSIPLPNSAATWADSGNFEDNHHHFHRRSCSVNDVFLGGGWSEDGGTGFGWRPCMYFARGFCKNGNSCKFSHSGFADSSHDGSAAMAGSPSNLDGFDELLRIKAIQQQRIAAASQLMNGGPFPYNKGMNFDSPRSAAAALMMGEEFHKFGRCCPERNDFLAMGLGGNANSSSRQIYLTFPADSTFKEEDVSNYFSMFGPVQDVRIPYQQKRMFGFVTFVYPETVKMILAKGNPHFVCDSRVLVKPYKEKGKVADRKQQHNQFERGEFSSGLSPSGLDSGEPYDLPIGATMFYNTKEMMLRRKLEEEAELQQAIELQGRKLMNLQLMDLKNHHHLGHQFQPNITSGVPILSPAHTYLRSNQRLMLRSDGVNHEDFKENKSSQARANSPTIAADQKQELKEACDNSNGQDSGNGKAQCSNLDDDDLHESLEHVLPDNLFTSPTKSAGDHCSIFSTAPAEADDSTSLTNTSSSNHNIQKSPTTSNLNTESLKSCYF